MRIVVVTEKPSITRLLAQPARNVLGPDPALTLVSTLMLGAYRYAVPRHQAWADYPLIHRPDRLAFRPGHHWYPVEVDAQGVAHTLPEAEAEPRLRHADRLVFACDPDHTGVMGFDLSLKGVLGLPLDDHRTLADCPAWVMYSLDDTSIRRALAQPSTFADLGLVRRYGEVRRYVDHQFMINSWGVLGRCLEQVGAPREPSLSKYMVQVLFHMHRIEQQMESGQGGEGMLGFPQPTEGNLVHTMAHWTGTGRYPANQNIWMGSAASRASILANLVTLGLLQFGPGPRPARGHLTMQGRTLMTLLHPGCEDRDLPFRLHAWAQAGLDESRPAIDRYVRTWFGRQKRRLDAAGSLED